MGIKIKSAGARNASKSVASGSGDGWEDAPTKFDRRVVLMDINGDTGTGRTRLALTAPGPIALAHTAEKIDGIVQRVLHQKQVKLLNFGGSFSGGPQTIANEAALVWNKMSVGWYSAMDTWAKTLIMDTASEGWEMIRLARFGEVNPRGRIDHLYGPVNGEWRSLFKHFRMQDRCNVITIHQTKDEYIDKKQGDKMVSQKTGRTIRTGMKEMPYIADVIVRTDKDPMRGTFSATIEKGWWNADCEGTVFTGDDVTFANIMSVVTETDAIEWGGE